MSTDYEASPSAWKPMPRGLDALFDLLHQMDRRIYELEHANPLAASGLRLTREGLVVESSLNVEGNLDVAGSAEVSGLLQSQNYVPGASGWRLTSTGLEVNDITLRGGIIGNAALVSPVTFDRVGGGVGNLAIPTAVTALRDDTIPVPVGYSKAIVVSIVSLSLYNSSASGGYVYLAAKIDATDMANGQDVYAPPGSPAFVGAHATATLTGLSGGSIHCRAMAHADSAIPANTGTICVLDAIAIFLR